jgi:hypothetical protein
VIGCITLCDSRDFGAWWLHVIMIVVEESSLVAILAQWIASMMDLWFGELLFQHLSISRILLVWMS